MREGESFARETKWNEAIEKWEAFYNSRTKKVDKAKAANNIAFAYEMLGEMVNAYQWAKEANGLFNESSAPNSIERRRSYIYMNEIERRKGLSNKINMQLD